MMMLRSVVLNAVNIQATSHSYNKSIHSIFERLGMALA